MPKRKASVSYSSDGENDVVPIPIQFFFWNQTSLFIKQKFGPLTEAHAMNFEKVIVQNILHGLSPGLSDAISSITRWSFIKASFPHIMHACASALHYRKENNPGAKLTKTEIKLLYTLHWLIIDAASECEDNAATQTVKVIGKKASIGSNLTREKSLRKGGHRRPTTGSNSSPAPPLPTDTSTLLNEPSSPTGLKLFQVTYLHSVSTIQLFVYLFVPLLKSLTPDDLDNLKLSNGLKIWEPLWSYRQPSLKIFNTPVKQKYETGWGENFIFVQERPDRKSSLTDTMKKKTVATDEKIVHETAEVVVTKMAKPVVKPTLKPKDADSSGFGSIYMGASDNAPIGKKPAGGENTQENRLSRPVNMPKSTSCVDNITSLQDHKHAPIHSTPSQVSFNNELGPIMMTSAANAGDLSQITGKLEERRSDSIHISDFETDTIRDSLNEKTPIRTLHTAQNQILPGGSSASSSSVMFTSDRPPVVRLKAPLVHMSSICSISEAPSQVSTPRQRSLYSQATNNSDTLTIFCPKCNFILQSLKMSSLNSYVETVSSVNCKNCFGIIKVHETTVKTPATSSLCTLTEFTEKLSKDFRNMTLKTTSEIEDDSKLDLSFENAIMPLSNLKTSESPCAIATAPTDSLKPQTKSSLNATTPGSAKSKLIKLNISIKDATFFDVAVLRCLLCPKWNSEGYLWSLEYLSYRVVEITDLILREQDNFFRVKSSSLPSSLNDLCILMGMGSFDLAPDEEVGSTSDLILSTEDIRHAKGAKSGMNTQNEFIELINQIYLETDFSNSKLSFSNMYYYTKRKKYEANFQTRIRRMRYIDEDLQARRKSAKRATTTNNSGEKKVTKPLPTHPFTMNELQSIEIQTSPVKTKPTSEANFSPTRQKKTTQCYEWSKDFDQKYRYIKGKVSSITKEVENNLNNKRYSSRMSLNRPVITTKHQHAANQQTQSTASQRPYLSYSDTNINYRESYEEVEEAGGSAGFINMDGTLNLNMILKGLHSVLLKENSIKLCDLSLNIMENLINIDLLPSEEIDQKLDQAKQSSTLSQSSHVYLNNLESKYHENYFLAADLMLRNIKWLGCVNCHSSIRSFSNDQLRGKTKLIIGRLYKKNPIRFKKFFKAFIETSDINHLMELFHSLFGYCHDSSWGLSHYYPYIKTTSSSKTIQKTPYYETKKSNAEKKNQTNSTFNLESVMIEVIIRPLVERLIDMKSELTSQENLYLFSEIRNLLSYIKENHGGLFRRVAFSSMLEPYMKLNQEVNLKNMKLKEIDQRLAELDMLKTLLYNLRDSVSGKQSLYVTQSSIIKSNKSSDNLITEEDNLLAKSSSPIVDNLKGQRRGHILKSVGSKSNLDEQSYNSAENIKKSTLISDNQATNEPVVNTSRRDSEVSMRRSKKNLVQSQGIGGGGDEHGEEIESSSNKKKAVDDQKSIRRNLSMLMNRQDVSFLRDIDKNDLELIQQLYDQALIYRRKIQNERCFISSKIIFKGLEYYRFLMECLPPAAIPDVPFMAALLEIEAPVISKATFLLETAYFVNRCNRKDWPEWIKMNIGVYRPYGSFLSSKSLPNTAKRNKIYQLAAANIFSAWGEVLAMKLESILKAKEGEFNEPDLSPEDYFDDSLVNASGDSCPFALQNIVCLLLLEITKFLRETYQYMPKKVTYQLKHETGLTGILSGGAGMPSGMHLGASNSGRHKESRAHRIVPGSVFSNDSSNLSIGGGIYPKSSSTHQPTRVVVEPSKISSSDNISVENEPYQSDNVKHIHFAIGVDNNPNEVSFLSSKISDENLSRVSNGDFVGKTGNVGVAPAAASATINTESETHVRSASATHQRRTSVKGRRTSLKYKLEKSSTGRSGSGGAAGTSSGTMGATSSSQPHQSSVKRKTSQGASISASEQQDSEYAAILNVPNANIDEILIISEEDSVSNSYTAPHTGSESAGRHASTIGNTAASDVTSVQQNEYCEVDEVDFNRCFPWIKVVVKFLNSIDYNCTHSSGGNPMPTVKSRKIVFSENCSKNCHLKLFKNSHSLTEAVLRIYETSNNLRLFEKYQKQMKFQQQTKEPMMAKHRLSKIEEGDHHSSSKMRKSSQNSQTSQKIHFMNHILKRSIHKNLINMNANNLNAEKQKANQLRIELNKMNEKIPTIGYVYNQVHFLNQIPLIILCKSALIISDEFFSDIIKICWSLLLNSDQEISSSSAALFLIGSMKQPNFVEELMRAELRSSSVNTRYQALLKFEVLWKFRYHVWPHLESNAHNLLKISPPCIEFVLPSPPIGIPYLQPVDPPWMPKAKTKVEEVTINQEEVRAVVTASKSRKKHQQEKIYKALEADQLNKRIARENFNFTNLNYLHYASFEPFLFQSKDETEEEEKVHHLAEEIDDQAPTVLTMRRQSASMAKRLQQRNSTTFIFGGPTGGGGATTATGGGRKSFVAAMFEGADENAEANMTSNEMQQSQPIFPTSVSSAVLSLIDLLFDDSLNYSNHSISTLAQRIIWTCLTEDTTLFLRYFFEKITQKEKKGLLIQYLKKMINFFVYLPSQTAYVLFNYLLGVVMFHVRTTNEGSQEAVTAILTIIWQIVSSVNGIVFKDLKQTLRKEQCDPSLLITANVPSAKKLIVHGPDLSQIPTQFPIYDNTQFLFLIQESFGFFKIPESKKDRFFLFDVKTNQVHLPDTYVRNYYFFRRNIYPQLSLVEMDPKEGNKLLERTSLGQKTAEQCKVLFFRKLLDNAPVHQVNATAAFLHEELIKLPMFPRKALESDFSIFSKFPDREVLTNDMLHKYSWCQLIGSLFASMDAKTASTWDISLFLTVVNGTLILHCEDLNTIRTCLAIYINSASHFQHVFATNGFLLVMPTLMKIYSNMQVNPVLKSAIEFTVLQFYLMHRIPFILQLFGSVAQSLDLQAEKNNTIDTNKVQSSCLFNILMSLENNQVDALKLLDLVKLQNIDQGFLANSSSSSAANNSQTAGSTAGNAGGQAATEVSKNVSGGEAANSPTSAPVASGGPIGSNPVGSYPFSYPSMVGNSSSAPIMPPFSSPAGFLTTSSSAVLAVSGISATNLLITSSGALGFSQIANLNAAVNSSLMNNNPGPNTNTIGPLGGTIGPGGYLSSGTEIGGFNPSLLNHPELSAGLHGVPVPASSSYLPPAKNNEGYKTNIKPLDFCYSDENQKFTCLDAINLCVTVIAYATHTPRANQMLTILDVIVPRYLSQLKQDTDTVMNSNRGVNPSILNTHPSSILDKQANMHYHMDTVNQARSEFLTLQKIAVSIKTLVSVADFLTRTYTGPSGSYTGPPKATTATPNLPLNVANVVATTNPHARGTSRNDNRSASILPDEDSIRYTGAMDDKKPPLPTQQQQGSVKDQAAGSPVGGGGNLNARQLAEMPEDNAIRQEFRTPRDTLLNIVSEFVFFASKRIKELYKVINDPNLKMPELVDVKGHAKLVEIAHTLLKLWDDSVTLSGNGIQNYFQKLLPVTDWSQEELKPSFNNLLRRIDRLFTKISKKPATKKFVDWTSIAGILNGLYITLDKQESIAQFPYFKMLINSVIALILNETMVDSTAGLLSSGSIFGSSFHARSHNSGDSFHIPIIFSKNLIKLVGKYITALKDQSNFEQLFGSSGSNPITPSMPSSIAYLINFLLPLLFWSASDRKDSPKLNTNDISFVVTILLNALKPPSKLAATLLLQAPKQHHLVTALDPSLNSNIYNKSAKQIKDIMTQSTYLALKLLTFGFSKQIELTRISNAIRQICFKAKNIYLWKYLDFITTNRTPLFLILKPFIENFVATQNCETDAENNLRKLIQAKLNCEIPVNSKCNNIIMNELIEELNNIKTELLQNDNKTDQKGTNADTEPKEEDKKGKEAQQNVTPTRGYLFKFNKNKKEANHVSQNSGGSGSNPNSDPVSQHTSVTSTPRKKIEKLNYKSGIEILEAYKLKYKTNINLYEKTSEELTNQLIAESNKTAASNLVGEESTSVKESVLNSEIKAKEEENVKVNEINEVIIKDKDEHRPYLKSVRNSIKNKMRKVVEEKRMLLSSAEANENQDTEQPATETATTSATDQAAAAATDTTADEKKDGKKSKLKKIVFV